MVRVIFFLAFSILLWESASGQKARIDSLILEINTNEVIDSGRVANLNTLTSLLGRSNPLLARQYATEAISISRDLGFPSQEATGLGNMGISYAIQGELDSAQIFLKLALDSFLKLNDLEEVAKVRSSLGTTYAIQAKFDTAIVYLLDTLPVFEELGDSVRLGLTYYNIGQMYQHQKLYAEALERTLKAEEIYAAIGREDKIPTVSAAISQFLIELDKEEEALTYINRGLESLEKYVDLVSAHHLNNMAGRIYEGKDEYMKAGEYYQKALEFATRLNSKRFVINASYNLAGVEYRLGDYLSSKTHLTNLLKTIEEEKYQGLDRTASDALDFLALNENKLGNNREAFQHMRRSKEISDSLYKEDNVRKIAELETIYETEKKEQEIKLLEAENESSRLKTSIAILTGIFMIAFISLTYWQTLRRRAQQRRLELESVHREMENYGMLISEKDDFISGIVNRLRTVNSKVKTYESKKELNSIIDALSQNTKLTDNEELLLNRIEQVSSGFFHKLDTKYESLTKTEKRLASLAQMELSNKEISHIMGINPRSVTQARYRLKKKLQLENNDDLVTFLKSMAD